MAYPNNNKTLECYRGDIFYVANSGWCVGSEQRGDRPAIIVSNDMANKHSPNVSIVYLTSQEKKPLPTHVEVICKVPSTALCENIQTVSKDRLADFVKSCTTSENVEVYRMGKLILDLCGGTGSWSKPYRDAGYEVKVITLPHYDLFETQERETACVL